MSNNGPKHIRIPMNPEEVEKLLATGDYDMPVNPVDQKISNIEKQIKHLQEQQKNILEYIKELATAITESNSDISQ